MGKRDMLFLERHCSKCGPIKAVLDMDAVESDDFRGRDGQELMVFSSQSPSASEILLDAFGIRGIEMPVLVRSDGGIVNSPKKILEYLTSQRMTIEK